MPSPLLLSGYPSVSALVLLRAARRRGLDLTPALQGLTEQDLERTLTMPWPIALKLCDEAERHLDETGQHAVIRDYLATHPLIRAIAPFMASPTAFLDILWRGSIGVSMPLASTYDMTGRFHELATTLDELGLESTGFTTLTGLVAIYATEVVGAPALEMIEWESSATRLRVRLTPPLDLSSPERRLNASNASIGVILESLQLMGSAALGAVNDGRLVFPGREATVQELLRLAGDWKVTPTEARVALALADGRSPSDVAKELSIAVATVRVHLKHLYAKTDTAGQRELIAHVAAWRGGV